LNQAFKAPTGYPSDGGGHRRPGTRIDDENDSHLLGARRRRGYKRKIAIAILLGLSMASFVYLFVIPSNVAQHTVTSGSLQIGIVGPGILDATNKVIVTSRIPGFLKSLKIERNDLVTTGQTLAELDAKDIRSQFEGALADLDAAKSAVLEAGGNREKAKAALDKANMDHARRRALSSGVISQAELASSEIAVRQASAEYERSVAIEERSRAQVRVASAAADVLQHKLDEAQIRSPLNGVVISRDRSVGDLLTVGVQLAQLVDPASIVISTRLDESVMGMIEPGQSATVTFTSDTTQAVDAKVIRVGRSVDPETREFVVDLSPERLPRSWALGQRAHVSIQVPLPPHSIVVPFKLISRRDGRPGVWRRVVGRAVWTPVEMGATSGTYVQLLQGVKPGDVLLDPRGRYTFEAVSGAE
jgi:HlyD family secretion protein